MFQKMALTAASATLLAATLAMAADSDLNFVRTSADLGACGGVATLVKNADGKAEIRLKNVQNCSNITLQMKLDRSDSGEYSLVLPMETGKEASVLLSSNSGKTQAELQVNTDEESVLPQVLSGDTLKLTECRGSVKLVNSLYGDTTLIFRNVRNCTNLKVLANNGVALDYSKKLQDQGPAWGGSFTLPKHVVNYGRNRVKVSLEGYLGTKDQFMLIFDSYNR